MFHPVLNRPRMRILIATVTAGGGHLAAASAIQEAWRKLRPDDVVEKADVLDFASKFFKKIYSETYARMVAHVPELYGMVFKKTDRSREASKLSAFRRTFAHRTNRGFVRYLKQFKPDVVLCPHYLPLEIFSYLDSKQKGVRPRIVCIVTDFEAHAFWIEPSVDLYCVAAEETRASLLSRGAAPDQVAVTGIPIAARFSASLDPGALRKKLGLRDDLPVLLVLSGGFGMGPVEQILTQLDRSSAPFQTLVVTGRNEDLRQTLASQDRRHPTHVLGFSTNMHELMAVAGLILTKPGGLTTSEAMAMGKPLLIIHPIPGQESANSDFLLERGAALKINRLEDLPFRLQQMLGAKKRAAMSAAARKLGRPDAAAEICRVVIGKFGETPKIIPAPPPRR